MVIKKSFASACATLGAAIATFTLFSSVAAAKDPEFTVAYHVSAQGLDLKTPEGARELYFRVKHAVDVVCTHGMRVDLARPSDPQACHEDALARAVRSFKQPLLTQLYLATHTLQEAETRGIDVPVQFAFQ